MTPQAKPFEAPAWARWLLRVTALAAFLLLLAGIVPAWRPRLAPLLGLAFGSFWTLFGLFTLGFSWALPRRGGGFVSPTQSRPLWLLIGFGTVFLGAACVVISVRSVIHG